MRTLITSVVGNLVLALAVACAPAPPSGGSAPRIAPQITAADLRNANEPIESIIQRKVSGVTLVRNSSGELQLRIRGRSAFSEGADPQPMYVIDGVQSRMSNPLSGLNLDDIESITVLKGAEGAVYGTDALNGVIVVVTKKGGKGRP